MYIFILEYPGVYWKWSHRDVETVILRRTMWLFQSGNTSSGQKTLNATQPEEEDKRAVFLQWWGQTRRLHTCACSCSFIVPLRSCSVYGTSRLRVVLFWIGLQFNIGQDELHRHDEGGVWISAHGRLVLTWNNKKTFRTYGRANAVSTKPGERCRFWTGVKTLTRFVWKFVSAME